MNGWLRLAAHLHRAWLRLYPPAFRSEFEVEMRAVFHQAAQDAVTEGGLAALLLRELREAPAALAAAYWSGWRAQFRAVLERLRVTVALSDLPPPPDGRRSWRQAGWELGLLLLAGLGLIAATYLPWRAIPAGWQGDMGALGRVIVPATLPVCLAGLARGLPRWAYPAGGLLLSYGTLAAHAAGLLPFVLAMLLLTILVAGLALFTDPPRTVWPAAVRDLGQSVALDWTRLSFGVYGAMPLVISLAFDDAQTNARTAYLALAVLGMLAGAALYCRSRQRAAQLSALLVGLSLAIGAAMLDRAAFANGLASWSVVPRLGGEAIAWLLSLWALWAALLLAPAVITAAGRAARLDQAR